MRGGNWSQVLVLTIKYDYDIRGDPVENLHKQAMKRSRPKYIPTLQLQCAFRNTETIHVMSHALRFALGGASSSINGVCLPYKISLIKKKKGM